MICRPKLKIHAWDAWQRNPWKLAVICLMALSSMSVQAQGQDYANPQMAGACRRIPPPLQNTLDKCEAA